MRKYIIVLFLLVIFQQCESFSCEDMVNKYRKVSFEMKIENISDSGTRHFKIEGKDKLGIHQSWKDFSSWLLEINKIEVGDSIIKPKEKAYILLKKMSDTTYTKYYYECEGKKYE